MLYGQDPVLPYQDGIWLDNIKTVQFGRTSSVHPIPVTTLSNGSILELTFDDLDGDSKDYIYEIVHCDRNWLPSELEEMEYLDGFNGEEIEGIEFSENTIVPFTQYTLTIPNEDVTWTKSGNYILLVYEDEGDKILAVTRRFMVVEPLIHIEANVLRARDLDLMNTHQAIEFRVNRDNIQLDRPTSNIHGVILQNGRWDNAIGSIQPRFQTGKYLEFAMTDQFNFPALKEFRLVDLGYLHVLGEGTQEIYTDSEGTDIFLELDLKHFGSENITSEDQNGNFTIYNREAFNDHSLESDYVNAHFALKSPTEYYDADVYILGKFTDWQLKPEFRMSYNYKQQMYKTSLLMKQGVYDYIYVLKNKDGAILFEELEGSWYETENDYTILIYYSDIRTRHDRLIGVTTINSNF